MVDTAWGRLCRAEGAAWRAVCTIDAAWTRPCPARRATWRVACAGARAVVPARPSTAVGAVTVLVPSHGAAAAAAKAAANHGR